jgi:hypothetical protein
MSRILAFVSTVLVPYVLLVTPIVFAHCWLHRDMPVAITAQVAQAPAPTPPPPRDPPFRGS